MACAALGEDPQGNAGAPPAAQHASSEPASSEAAARLERWQAVFPAALATRGAIAPSSRPDGSARFASPQASVELPGSADGAAVLTDVRSGMRAAFALAGASPAPLALADGLALYPGAAPGGADVIHRPRPNGTEDFVVYPQRPAAERLAYTLDVTGVAGLRLVARTLELLDAKGSPRLRVAPPYVLDARGARRVASIDVEGCAFQTDPRAPWGRPIVPPGASSCTVVVRWDGAGLTYPIAVDPVWETTDVLVEPRYQAAAAALDDASAASVILVTGGFDAAGVALDSAELYFPLERAFAKTGDMQVKRAAHTATLLPSGKVLVAGGLPDTVTMPQPSNAETSLEVYDTTTGAFTTVAVSLSPGRALHTATLLDDGTVLFAGGTTLLGQPTTTAVRFDPVGPGFTSVGGMSTARAAHTATGLRSGKVLIVGGFVQAQNALLSAELFDPATNAFEGISALGAGYKTQMTKARAYHTATRIDCKTVLVTGGTSKATGGIVEATAELWQDDENAVSDAECPTVSAPTVRGFSSQLVAMTAARSRHTATLLPTGQVVLVGGTDGTDALFSTELYDPALSTFSAFVDLPSGEGRSDHLAVLVNAGFVDTAGRGVLVAGGAQGASVLQSAYVLSKNLGEACTLDQECASGFCTDGVCCNVRCDATCVACAAADKQDSDPAANGTCGAQKALAFDDILFGTTVAGELDPECNGETETHKFCNGAGQVFVKNFTCEPANCGANGFCTEFCDCNGADCVPGTSTPCAALGWCDVPNQVCEDKYPSGLPCTDAYQCLSGFCVDGICCQTACDNFAGSPCEACDVAGKLGVCSTVGTLDAPEQPHPNTNGTFQRPECPGDGACEGACVGQSTCVFPKDTVELQPQVCVECPEGDADCSAGEIVIERYLCDGAGSYQTVRDIKCGGTGLLRCDGDPGQASDCLPPCTQDADCLEDAFCDGNGACQALPAAGRCNEDFTELRVPGGADQPCDPYRCQRGENGAADACLTSCQSKADCIELACNTAGVCTDQILPAPDAPSCSASPGRPSGETGAPLLLLAAGALAVSRGRRRRRVASSSPRG